MYKHNFKNIKLSFYVKPTAWIFSHLELIDMSYNYTRCVKIAMQEVINVIVIQTLKILSHRLQ